MANLNFLDPRVRKTVISEIKSSENKTRKAKSLKSYEIYNDNSLPYVRTELINQLSAKTVEQMQIISNLNIAKAVVTKEANIYTDEPEREYESISESDKKALEMLYEDCNYNTVLSKANKYYKLSNQSFIQAVPKDGKIKLRVLQCHNVDVIPDESDPEQAYAYIISNFDKSGWIAAISDGVNQNVAESDDYKRKFEQYQVWTKEIVFTMDGDGNVTGEILENPLQTLPFVDIAKDKDFEFFVRIGQALTDFTVDFNVAWSDQMFTTRMQGYSVGVLSGDPNLKPDTMTVGANKMIFLPVSAANPDSKLSFEFVSPNPNTDSSLKTIDSLISTFLTTRGLDSKAITSSNGGNNYTSALERLLAMLDQFRASKDDFDLFQSVELALHKIVTRYLSVLSGTNLLDQKYWTTQAIDKSELNVTFSIPEMVETEADKLANEKVKIEMGISDKVLALAEIDGVSEDEAIKRLENIDKRKLESMQKMIDQMPQDPNQAQLVNGNDINANTETQPQSI